MAASFDYFVIFAEMRTGSNYLESNLNTYAGITCYGEVFNPHFIAGPNKPDLCGYDLKKRDGDPIGLIEQLIKSTDGLAGFRVFHDHDKRAISHCLDDLACAKIILTRNPVDTYVSREIARQTGQWQLGDMRQAKSAKITFDFAQFKLHLDVRQKFQIALQTALQKSGQTAFYLGYDDLLEMDIVNGLVTYLGATEKRKKASKKTKKQNPEPLDEKILNYQEMLDSLASIDHFELGKTPNFEPKRGPFVPSYVAAAKAPLIFMPIKNAPRSRVLSWLAAIDGETEERLQTGFDQKSLRQWKRKATGHRSFTVLRHPVARLYQTFSDVILSDTQPDFLQIRETLRNTYGVASQSIGPGTKVEINEHKRAFLKFAEFVKGNLAGQCVSMTLGHRNPNWFGEWPNY